MTKAASLANPATKAALKATDMEDIVDGGYVIIGSPDEVDRAAARGRAPASMSAT